ncbi:MAG: hypothetical protein JW759_02180 [Candidatus Coatesbacteria bacterium]|nr:hypothetical protein [Candidatus Coatesbacteria bacterium]
MHSRLHNRAVLSLSIKPRGPLLVRAGHTMSDASLMLEHNVETPYGDDAAAPFIPGSSLKGVIRSHFERVAACCGIRACESFSSSACSRRVLSQELLKASEGEVYSGVLCAACKVFGCEKAAGRFWARDAMPSADNPPTRQLRATLPIDRFLGSSRFASAVDFEAVVGGEFETQIVIENFELWQLAMIGIVLMDLDDGYVQIGGLRSKGFGLVAVEFSRCEFFFAKSGLLSERIYGIGSLVSEQRRSEFGYMGEDWLALRRPSATDVDGGLRAAIDYDVISDVFGLKSVIKSHDAIKSLLTMLLNHLLDYASRQRATPEKANGERG